MFLSNRDRLAIAYSALREWGRWARGGLPQSWKSAMPTPKDFIREMARRRFADDDMLRMDRIVARLEDKPKRMIKKIFILGQKREEVSECLQMGYDEMHQVIDEICKEFAGL